MSYNAKADRTFRINGSVSIAGKIALFVQGMDIAIDAGVLQRDSTGIGESVFTQNGDVIGSFSFSLKNTIDLYDTGDPPTMDETISKWMQAVDDFDPSLITFIQTFNAPKATSNKEARITFTGRVMTPATSLTVDNAVEDANVAGEITVFTSAQRIIPP